MFQRKLCAAILPALLIVSAALVGCDGENRGPATDCTSAIERQTLLEREAQKIGAALDRLASDQRALNEAIAAISQAPTRGRMDSVRQALHAARLSYIELEPYTLVVDPDQARLPRFNGFPVDTSRVLAYVTDVGAYDPNGGPDFDRGYPAIEFLLHGTDEERAYQQLLRDPGRLAALQALSGDLLDRALSLAGNWSQFRVSAFREATGTDAGSGLAQLINSLSKHLEDTRRDRLGTPFGVTLGFPSPQTVEAPYSGRSLEYLRRAIGASQQAYGSGDGASLDAYLAAISSEEGSGLAQDITAQYAEAQTLLVAVDGPLAAAVETDRDDVQAVYGVLSRQVVNLKTDLPTVTCVAITYVDNPSDSD